MSDNTYPSEPRAKRVLTIAYPNSDPELRENLAYLVSVRRCTIDQALQILLERKDEKPGDSPVMSATSRAILTPSKSPAVASTSPTPNGTSRSVTPTATKTGADAKKDDRTASTGTKAPAPVAAASRNPTRQEKNGSGASQPPPQQSSAGDNESTEEFYFPKDAGRTVRPRTSATPAPTTPTSFHAPIRHKSDVSCDSSARPVSPSGAALKHFFYGDDVDAFNEAVLSQTGQVILFTTSMTGSRGIRDNSRSLETLLYIKKVPYHYVDIADNICMQRLVRLWHQQNTRKFLMPTMPILFVDQKLIGNYEEIQEMENDGVLDAKMRRAGYKAPEDLPEKPDYFAKERAAFMEENGKTVEPQAGSPAPLSPNNAPTTAPPSAHKKKEVVLSRPSKSGNESGLNASHTNETSTSATPSRTAATRSPSAASPGATATGATREKSASRLVTLPPPSKSKAPTDAMRRASGETAATTSTGGGTQPSAAVPTSLPATPKQRMSSTRTTSSAPTNTSHESASGPKPPLQHQRLPAMKTTTTSPRANGVSASNLGTTPEKRSLVLSHPTAPPPVAAEATAQVKPTPPSSNPAGRTPAPRSRTGALQVQKAPPPGPTTRPKADAAAAAISS